MLRPALVFAALVVGASFAPVALAGGPSTAQMRSLLAGELTPPAKSISIASLLKHGGVTFPFKALAAGSADIEWTRVPPPTKRSRKLKLATVIVASGATMFSAPGTKKMRIVLTAEAGTQLLKESKSIKLTATGVFTPKRGKSVRASKTFTLTR